MLSSRRARARQSRPMASIAVSSLPQWNCSMPSSVSRMRMPFETAPHSPSPMRLATASIACLTSPRLTPGNVSTLVLSDTRRRSAKVERAEYRYRPTSRFALQRQLGFCFQELDAPVAFLKRPVDQAKRYGLLVGENRFLALVLLYVRGSEFKGVEDQRWGNFQPGFVGTIGIH